MLKYSRLFWSTKIRALAPVNLPDKEGQMYFATEDKLYLIPTAEVPITNIYRDVILTENQLPVKNVGYTPCFRREAGSWGAHVRGLNRLHQFDKVEIVRIEKPENSYAALEEMSLHVQSIVAKAGTPLPGSAALRGRYGLYLGPYL